MLKNAEDKEKNMTLSPNPIEVVRNLIVEQVIGKAGKLEIAVKNNTPGSNIKRLVFIGNSPIAAGNRINVYVSRRINTQALREDKYGVGTGDISCGQSGELHNIGQPLQNIQTSVKAIYLEILDQKGNVLRTDYEDNYKSD